MDTSVQCPKEYCIPVSQDHIRSIKDPHLEQLTIIHALVKIRDFSNGAIPDKINPRSHDELKMSSKIPQAIAESLNVTPEHFHLLNRGCLILAKKAWYNNQNKKLHFIIESEDDHGMVDGATTDRVLARLKDAADTELSEAAYIHLEIIAGDVEQRLRINLADARNTSVQVKEFSLQDLGGNFDWLKEILEKSEFRGKVRYRENEPEPVDIRSILALLTLFHPQWVEEPNKEPIVAYTGKGTVLNLYSSKKHKAGYEKLSPIVLDILKLYDYIHVEFQEAYKRAYGKQEGKSPKLGKRNEVQYMDKNKAKELKLTGKKTQYVLPDGWLYPLLASFRMLLDWSGTVTTEVRWITDPFKFFSENGHELVYFLVERSEELGRNANATGKSKTVWTGLRDKVEIKVLKSRESVRTI